MYLMIINKNKCPCYKASLVLFRGDINYSDENRRDLTAKVLISVSIKFRNYYSHYCLLFENGVQLFIND